MDPWAAGKVLHGTWSNPHNNNANMIRKKNAGNFSKIF
jgi:hypothetical protein